MSILRNGLYVAVLFSASQMLAGPTVHVTGVVQDSGSRAVRVAYSLDEDAIVTVAIEVGGRAMTMPRVYGDVNALVESGERSFSWSPVGSEPCAGSAVSFTVSAWAPDDPPTCLVCDLDLGTVAYYASTNDLPGGVGSDAYRTSKLLMRRIPSAGSSFLCCGTARRDISRDFWLGAFEVTQEQYRRVMRAEPGTFVEPTSWACRPVCGGLASGNVQLFFNELRGDANETTVPEDPSSSSFFGILRTRFSQPFDLPSEAQWDFANRAGSSGSLPSGVEHAEDIGRFSSNGGLPAGMVASTAYLCGSTNGTACVGSYPPNAYGLYDTLGNVWEWCLDGYEGMLAQDVASDYVNRTVASRQRVRRGGCWRESPGNNNNRSHWESGLDNAGFRCACGGIAGTSRQPYSVDNATLDNMTADVVLVDTPFASVERRFYTMRESLDISFNPNPFGFNIFVR